MRLAAPATSAQPLPVSTSAPDFVPQCTSASRSSSVIASMRTTSGWIPVAANQAGCISQPRAASAARTASGVCAASAVIFIGVWSRESGFRELTQGLNDLQPRRTEGWEEATDDAHQHCEYNAGEQERGGDAEAERDFAEARPV